MFDRQLHQQYGHILLGVWMASACAAWEKLSHLSVVPTAK
jgi:hypothetical protein